MVAPPEACVLREDVDGVVVLTINRPSARNAVNEAVSTALGTALADAEQDIAVRAIILTGAGDTFCAGADLKALAAGASISAHGHPEWGFAGVVNHPVSVPIIAAVNGFALGGGTELTLACDLAVAGRSAQFGLPEVHRGIMAAGGGAVRLARQLPPKIAAQLLLTGEPIDADEAARLGLVNTVVPDDAVLPAALELAGRITRAAPLAIRATKRTTRAIRERAFADEAAAWAQNIEEITALRRTADADEGMRAFAEKRSPRWEGR